MYASKYPPGQALFLALGQCFFGSAFSGVLVGNALMLFTFCLMLFAFVPPRWALSVSAMFGLILSPGMYWTNSYWGGSVAASGGALVLLAIGVLRKRQTPIAGVIFAVGVLLLFWTRPYEGGVFTLIVLVVFAKELWQKRRIGIVVAAVAVFALGGAWTCYYNQAVTGKPLLFPYLLHDRQYNVTPVFWFLPLRPEPAYSHPRLAAVHGSSGWEASNYYATVPRSKFLWTSLYLTLLTLIIPFRAAILIALLIPAAWRDPLIRKMAIIAEVVLLALIAETYHQEHYTAPLWPVLALLIAVWAERAWNLRVRKVRVGAALVLLAFTTLAITSFLYVSTDTWNRPLIQPDRANTDPLNWPNRRAALIERLSALGQRQLVIVRYPSPDWNINVEWVYNGADIDQQRVIFAHDLGTEQNRAMLNYYPDRTVLLLTFDSASWREKIEPYIPALLHP
jgi:hypothetical protein